MTIKQILAVIVLTAGMLAGAANQYTMGKFSSASNDYANNSDQFAGYIDKGGNKLGIQNALFVKQSSYAILSIVSGDVANFGAVKINGNQITEQYTLTPIADGKYTLVNSKGEMVQLQPGETLGFWAKDKNDNIVYNTPGLEGGNSKNYVGTDISKSKDAYTIGFGEWDQYISSTDFSTVAAAPSVITVQLGSEQPVGQPLPGVLAALAIGGGAAYWAKRRKASKQN